MFFALECKTSKSSFFDESIFKVFTTHFILVPFLVTLRNVKVQEVAKHLRHDARQVEHLCGEIRQVAVNEDKQRLDDTRVRGEA